MLHLRIKSLPNEKINCRLSVVFLAFCWLSGILFGFFSSRLVSVYLSSLMCSLVCQRVSIVGMLIIFTFPLLLSVVLMHFSARFLLYIFVVFKAFCFSFTFSCIFLSFGSAGWLICFLAMFSNSVLAITLLWFWLRFFLVRSVMVRRDAEICCAVIACTVCVDYFFVAPFLVSLINYS